MLVSFSLENWMSFREPVTFSMIASRERQHGDRVPRLGKYSTRVLPVAAIYGGNASGKTNFFKALNFARDLIVVGTRPDGLILVEPFRLDGKMADQPSRFEFVLLIDETLYAFSFAVTREAVVEEKLVLISSASEKVLYHRRDGKIDFDDALAKDQFLQFAFQGTRDNQLFLTNSVSQKVNNFRPVYDWFRHTLVMIAPDSRFGPYDMFFDESHPGYSRMNEMLAQLDTGISRLGGEGVPFESIPLPESVKNKLLEDLKDDAVLNLMTEPKNERFVVSRKGGKVVARKLVAYHPKADGGDVDFEICQESDGSQRLINLLPAFIDLKTSGAERVYVIDEIDRSLHTLLTRRLLETYLASCSTETRTQLLLTTHDVLLMDQQLLRRDEMWVAERDSTGASSLISFSEYKDVRYDKDIRKSYLQGRMGGIPRILLGNALAKPCPAQEKSGVDA